MAKKLKITESQLQKLMERKHSYIDNTPEEEEVAEETSAESAIIKLDNEEEEEETNDEMMNESIESIKANFRRFL